MTQRQLPRAVYCARPCSVVNSRPQDRQSAVAGRRASVIGASEPRPRAGDLRALPPGRRADSVDRSRDALPRPRDTARAMSQENVEIVRRRYEALQRAATATRLCELLRTPTVKSESNEAVAGAGDATAEREGVARQLEPSSDEPCDEALSFRAGGGQPTRATVSPCRSRSVRHGQDGQRRSTSTGRLALVFTFRDGKIVARSSYFATEPKPSKPPGCRSRRCRRRTWRSCARAIEALEPRATSTPASETARSRVDAIAGRLAWTGAVSRPRGECSDLLDRVRRRLGADTRRAPRSFDRRGRARCARVAHVPRARRRAAASRLDAICGRLHVPRRQDRADRSTSETRRKPSKPPGCRSRRCRRRTWKMVRRAFRGLGG